MPFWGFKSATMQLMFPHMIGNVTIHSKKSVGSWECQEFFSANSSKTGKFLLVGTVTCLVSLDSLCNGKWPNHIWNYETYAFVLMNHAWWTPFNEGMTKPPHSMQTLWALSSPQNIDLYTMYIHSWELTYTLQSRHFWVDDFPNFRSWDTYGVHESM